MGSIVLSATRCPSPATSRTPLVRSRAANSLRILDPRPGTCYGPKPSEVPVSLQVDAPHGLLFDGNNFVEVGIDTNRDRELRRKETLRLTSDRQVDLFLERRGRTGLSRSARRSPNLHVLLPPPKMKAMRADMLARVSLATSDVWSEPIEVIFDDEPPRLSRLQLDPGATVTQGSDLEVSVLASDNELSGVAKVEAAFDLQRKGEFAEPPPLPASMQADGRWSVKLPTKPLRPGVYGLLVRATDRRGKCQRVSQGDGGSRAARRSGGETPRTGEPRRAAWSTGGSTSGPWKRPRCNCSRPRTRAKCLRRRPTIKADSRWPTCRQATTS